MSCKVLSYRVNVWACTSDFGLLFCWTMLPFFIPSTVVTDVAIMIGVKARGDQYCCSLPHSMSHCTLLRSITHESSGLLQKACKF